MAVVRERADERDRRIVVLIRDRFERLYVLRDRIRLGDRLIVAVMERRGDRVRHLDGRHIAGESVVELITVHLSRVEINRFGGNLARAGDFKRHIRSDALLIGQSAQIHKEVHADLAGEHEAVRRKFRFVHFREHRFAVFVQDHGVAFKIADEVGSAAAVIR